MVHSDVRRSPRTGAPASPSTALGVRSPISKARKLGTPSRPTASPSPARRRAAEQLRGERTPQRAPSSASSTPRVGSAPNYKIPEALTVRLNVYDLVWNRNDTRFAARLWATFVALRRLLLVCIGFAPWVPPCAGCRLHMQVCEFLGPAAHVVLRAHAPQLDRQKRCVGFRESRLWPLPLCA